MCIHTLQKPADEVRTHRVKLAAEIVLESVQVCDHSSMMLQCV